MWKKYYSPSVVNKWAYSGIIERAILPVLESHRNVEADLEMYLKVRVLLKADLYRRPRLCPRSLRNSPRTEEIGGIIPQECSCCCRER